MNSKMVKPILVEKELQIRDRLHVPPEAARVLILAESSHWDPNWLYTSEAYYARFVENNLLQAIAELKQEPRRIYSVECMFFLRMFWDRHLELHDTVRRLANEGQLRLTSSGVTSADTLLPSAEALLRDLLLGQEWLRKNGFLTEPTLAYYPDCFGHTPGLPSLLNAAGFKMTAFSRLDGMYMIGTDFDPKSSFPRPGSSAKTLQQVEKTLDFIWQGPDGSQVLAHWNAFTYFQGDMIAHRGIARAYMLPRFFAYPDRSDRLVRRRIQEYADQLSPLSRTSYLFCPIGMDFNPPVPSLLDLLDRYNRLHYPETGLWVVNAGLDDYLELVDCYRAQLPVLELDPNPYWTGFYTSRPSLKKRCYDLVDKLLLAEGLVALQPKLTNLEVAGLENAWWASATSNHHDFITGTSPDSVVEGEQVPMLDQAIGQVETFLKHSLPVVRPTSAQAASDQPMNPPDWEKKGEILVVKTPFYTVELDEAAGGCLRGLWSPESDSNWLNGISNELTDYLESGGLWRMGMEYKGGKFQLCERSSQQRVRLEVRSHPKAVEISSAISLGGRTYQQAILCQSDLPWISFRLAGRAADKHTLCLRFQTGLRAGEATMENPGGVVRRPVKKIYEPTFWLGQYFYHLQDQETGRGMAVLMARPGAIAYRPEETTLELVALRNATREKVKGFLNVPACPAEGHEKDETTFQFGILFTESGDWRENRLPQVARQFANQPWLERADFTFAELIKAHLTLSSPEVWLEAVKPAWRGEGLIVRLCSYTPHSRLVRLGLSGVPIREAYLCDGRERDLRSLRIVEDQVAFIPERSICTLRLIV